MKIHFTTIKQYNGTLTFDSQTAFEEERAAMKVDKSIVTFEAYNRLGVLVEFFENEFAQPITKHCPLEKSWVGTISPTDKELEQFGDTV